MSSAGDGDTKQILERPAEEALAIAEGQIVDLSVQKSRPMQRQESLVGAELDGCPFRDGYWSGRNRVFHIQQDGAFVDVEAARESVDAAENQRAVAKLAQRVGAAGLTDRPGDLQSEIVLCEVQVGNRVV